MPNLTIPKSALEPRANLPSGNITVMFKGFKPTLSKPKEGKERTVNLNPELVIVNDQRSDPSGKPLNGQKVFTSLNQSFGIAIVDFFHCLGLEMIQNGEDFDLPGYFDGDTSLSKTDQDVKNWGKFNGPALNEIGVLELAEVPSRRAGAKPTDTQTDIKRFICRVPGCTFQHMESLIRS